MMTDDANIDRITKRMESLMDDIKELAYSSGMSAIETMTKLIQKRIYKRLFFRYFLNNEK